MEGRPWRFPSLGTTCLATKLRIKFIDHKIPTNEQNLKHFTLLLLSYRDVLRSKNIERRNWVHLWCFASSNDFQEQIDVAPFDGVAAVRNDSDLWFSNCKGKSIVRSSRLLNMKKKSCKTPSDWPLSLPAFWMIWLTCLRVSMSSWWLLHLILYPAISSRFRSYSCEYHFRMFLLQKEKSERCSSKVKYCTIVQVHL